MFSNKLPLAIIRKKLKLYCYNRYYNIYIIMAAAADSSISNYIKISSTDGKVYYYKPRRDNCIEFFFKPEQSDEIPIARYCFDMHIDMQNKGWEQHIVITSEWLEGDPRECEDDRRESYFFCLQEFSEITSNGDCNFDSLSESIELFGGWDLISFEPVKETPECITYEATFKDGCKEHFFVYEGRMEYGGQIDKGKRVF